MFRKMTPGHRDVAALICALVAVVSVGVEGIVVTEPCCSTLSHQFGEFGLKIATRESDLVLPNVVEFVDGQLVHVPLSFCNSSEITQSLAGKIVLLPRGQCSFYTKVLAAQENNAVAVIVYETDSRKGGRTLRMTKNQGGPDTATIPSVFVSYATHLALLDELGSNATVEVVLNATGALIGEVPVDEARVVLVVAGVALAFVTVLGLMFAVWSMLPEYELEMPMDTWRNISIGGHRHPSMLKFMNHNRDRSKTENPRYSQKMSESPVESSVRKSSDSDDSSSTTSSF